MKGFISELAERLYDRYGDEVSSLRMVFPSRRARLFFSDALASVARRPLWQPRFESLGVAGMRLSDEIKLVTELYKVYSRYHDESFDAFYFWGGMLLADFDQIDKYLIDADMLFSNMGDLKALESDRSYLTAEQIEVIARFWRSFGLESEFSEEKERFMTIWRSMADVYHGFRNRLREQGLAYEGMIHREAAPEKMISAFSEIAVRTMSEKLLNATMTLTPTIPRVLARALRSSSRSPIMLLVR